MQKKIKRVVPVLFFLIALIVLFRPAGRITFDKSVSENRILFQYEIYGCGSVVGKVIDGGEEITSNYIEQFPDIGKDEVIFSKDSDEPRKHINAADFDCGGLAEKYTYIITGHPVGITRGALACCDLVPTCNENVVEFKVDKWYFTSYVPYIKLGNLCVIIIALIVVLVSFFWIVIMIIFRN